MSNIEHHGLVVPSNPEDRKRLKAGLDEIVNSLTRIAAERDQKKSIIQALFEEFEIPKKLISKVAQTMFAENFQKVFAEAEDVETLIEGLQLTTSLPNRSPTE